MLQNLDLQAITNLLLIIFLAVFLVKVSKVFDKLVKQSREERETVSEHVEIARPEQALGTLLKDNPVTNSNDDNKKILLEIEFPALPEKIKIPFEKLPELLKLLGKTEENPKFLMKEPENPKPYIEEASQLGGGTTKETEAPTSRGESRIGTVSFMEHHDKPWLDIISRVSGLEFSKDGEKVYCPRHGWVPYIVTSDGRILCGAEYETLWDPNRDRYRPPSKKELLKLQKDLAQISNEIEELRNMAQMQPIQSFEKKQESDIEEEDEEEESMEEYKEE